MKRSLDGHILVDSAGFQKQVLLQLLSWILYTIKKTIAKHCWPLDVHKVGNVITPLNHSWSDFRLEKLKN